MPDTNINWGMLQPLSQVAPIHTEATRAEPAPQAAAPPDPSSGAASPAAMMAARTDQQRLGIDQQRLQMEQKEEPGKLAQQGLINQGLGLENQTKQAELATEQYKVKMRQDVQKAYADGKAKGGTEGGLDAMQEKRLEYGDVDGYLTSAKTRENLKQDIAKGNQEGVAWIGKQMFGISQTAQETKTSELSVYTKQYPTLKKAYPDAPDPSSFKDNQQFIDTFLHPAAETALPTVQKLQAEQKAVLDNKQYQSSLASKQALTDLQNTVKTYGPDSPEAKQAAVNFQQQQQSGNREATGNNYVTGTFQSIKNALPSGLGGTPSPDETIKEQTGQSTSGTNSPVYKEDIQAELAARAQATQKPVISNTPGSLNNMAQQPDTGGQ